MAQRFNKDTWVKLLQVFVVAAFIMWAHYLLFAAKDPKMMVYGVICFAVACFSITPIPKLTMKSAIMGSKNAVIGAVIGIVCYFVLYKFMGIWSALVGVVICDIYVYTFNKKRFAPFPYFLVLIAMLMVASTATPGVPETFLKPFLIIVIEFFVAFAISVGASYLFAPLSKMPPEKMQAFMAAQMKAMQAPIPKIEPKSFVATAGTLIVCIIATWFPNVVPQPYRLVFLICIVICADMTSKGSFTLAWKRAAGNIIGLGIGVLVMMMFKQPVSVWMFPVLLVVVTLVVYLVIGHYHNVALVCAGMLTVHPAYTSAMAIIGGQAQALQKQVEALTVKAQASADVAAQLQPQIEGLTAKLQGIAPTLKNLQELIASGEKAQLIEVSYPIIMKASQTYATNRIIYTIAGVLVSVALVWIIEMINKSGSQPAQQ